MTFRRINPRTKLTFPCVFARKCTVTDRWLTYVAGGQECVDEEWGRYHYTHWLPFKWPGSGR